MQHVKGNDFCQYAGKNQARWKRLTGREVHHPTFGKGKVTNVVFYNHADIVIWVQFSQGANNSHTRHFDLSSFAAFDYVLLTDRDAQVIEYYLDLDNDIDEDIEEQSALEKKQPLTPLASVQKFQANQEVSLIHDPSQRGRIMRARIFNAGEWNYEVYFSAEDVRIYKESDLKLYAPDYQVGGLNELLSDLALIKLRRPLGDALYALYASRTKFEIYQYKPAVKFLANPDQRLLIADEVGLGKTIEAGIIFLELQARIGLDRVLIVCPSSLRHKWHDEMRSRFDEEFTILDMEGVHRFLDQYRQAGTQARLKAIISLELIRRREVALLFSDVKLDLMILDEAHHCRNTNTLANAIASTLTENSDAALMLTATPLQMGREDLFNLLNILSPGEFDNYYAFSERLAPNEFVNRASQYLTLGDIPNAKAELRKVEKTTEKQRFIGNPYYETILRILNTRHPTQQELITAQRRLLELNTLSSVFTRTRKRDIQEKAPIRTAYTLTVKFNSAEKRFYERVIDEVRQEFARSHWSGAGSGWVTIMKERQAASCISALRKREAEESRKYYPEDDAFESDFISNDDSNDGNDFSLYGGAGARLLASKRRVNNVSTKSVSMREINVDTKFNVFWKALSKVLEDNPTSKVLVFSFFVGTIELIQGELQKKGVNVRAIHGGYKVEDRHKIIEAFHDDPSIRVLISSDVGSEGLDFQFCDTLFNYDLPWNPMKVEQRIGRIDRFGQEAERIRIYNLVIEDSVEERILMRLYDRIEIFKQSIGDIEVILGDQIRELTQAVFSSRLSPEEEIRRAEQAANNVLKQKQDMEEFESKRLQFLGQEAIFSTSIEHTISSGRYVSDIEIHALVNEYIKEKFPSSRLIANKEDATYVLFARDDMVEEVKAFIFKQHKNDPSFHQFLRKLGPGKEIPLTFSHELAYQRKLLEFVTPRHPLALAAQEYWKNKNEEKKRLAYVSVETDCTLPGKYFFFIFLLDSQGIDNDSRLISVVIAEKIGDVHIELSKQFLRLLQTSSASAKSVPGKHDFGTLNNAEDAAMIYMTNMRDEIMQELKLSNEALVNARLAAVEQSYNAKVNRIEGIKRKVKDPSILRMYSAQLKNLAAKRKARVNEIEKGRSVIVNFSLKLYGFVEVQKTGDLIEGSSLHGVRAS